MADKRFRTASGTRRRPTMKRQSVRASDLRQFPPLHPPIGEWRRCPALPARHGCHGGAGRHLPEQVWDSDSIAARRLYPGRPTGSAMPLVWTHAEYIKLACSILEGRPEPLWARYRGRDPQAHIWYWSPQTPIRTLLVSTRPLFHQPMPSEWLSADCALC